MRLQKLLYTVAATLTLTACSSTEENTNGELRTPINLTYSTLTVAETRAGAAIDLNDANITSGRTVTVKVTPNSGATGGSTGDFVYTAGDAGAMTAPDTPPYYPSAGTVKLTAWHPSDAAASFTIETDQSTNDAFNASDLMYSNNLTAVSRTANAVEMQFTHKLAKLVVNITAGTGVTTITGVKVKNVKPTVSFDSTTGEVGAASGTATDIILFKEGTSGAASGAIVFPSQSLSGALLDIETDQGTATYALAAAKTYEAGKRYALALTVNRAAVGTTNTITWAADAGTVNVIPGDWTVSVSGTYTYTGSAIVPEAGNITVKTATDEDIAAGNYDVFVNNNTNAGEATLIVSGIGVYAGKVASCTYTIGKAAGSISYATTDVLKAVGNVFTNALTKVGDGTATYSSSNPGVATVDSSTGEVTVVAVGTTTITATAADGANYAYASPTTTYTLMVTNLTTLTALKALVNEGTDCSTYLGYEVNSNGDIAEKNVSGTLIGYISYISTSDVDKDISGSRILVIASEDAGEMAKWGRTYGIENGKISESGYSNTEYLQSRRHDQDYETNVISNPAAYSAWNYSQTIPGGGATPAHWFLPSEAQFNAMINACGGFEQLWEKLHFVSGSNYWSSAQQGCIYHRHVTIWSQQEQKEIEYDEYNWAWEWNSSPLYHVRACFAY